MRAECPGGNSVRTMAGLTDSQVAQHREQGWLAPIDVLTADEAADAPADLEAAEADFPDDVHAGGPLHVYAPVWTDPPMLYEGNPLEFEANHTFFPHMILLNHADQKAMTLGHSVVVTDTGCERLSRSSLDLVLA